MALHPTQLAAALDAIAEEVGLAQQMFSQSLQGNEYADAEWHLQVAYRQLLTLAEVQALPELRRDIMREFRRARTEGLKAAETDWDGEPYLKWAVPARWYIAALQAAYVHEPSRTVTRDLESILRATEYSLSDTTLFEAPPHDEATVHRRIEGLLRCVFPGGLIHKPRLSKPIKQFEPDTGIPSIHTLIEYKFLASRDQVAPIADQLLADTRGYTSREWTSFIYVIYETTRIRSENEWRQFLQACAIDSRTTLIVLSGEAAGKEGGRPPN
jgi:hypothetical protein